MNAKNLIQQLVPTLYEDEHILAVVKPSGIDASALRPGSGPGLLEVLADIRSDGETLRLANRLSRYESGVLVLAKDAAVAEHFRAGLKRHHVKQEYIAVVLGKMAEARLVIGSGRDAPRGPAHRERAAVPSRRTSRSRSRAKSGGSLTDRRSEGQTVVKALRTGAGRTMVHCRTTAENTHALRAQLRSARLRVLGDKLHEPKWRSRLDSLTCLHLAKVSFRHPASGTTTVLAARAPDVFARIVAGEPDVYRPLHAALVRRLSFVVRRDINAYRLLTGDVEDLKGLVVERFGVVAVLQVSADRPALTRFLPQIGRWYCRTLGLQAAYAKRFVKDRVGVESEVRASLHASEPLVGKEVPPEIEINERGMRFVIRPYDGFSVGLFLDQRENRIRVRAMADGLDVLNLFAYTCGFSVAAASGQATSVTSVDISSKHLDWGRSNFERNGLDPATHHWIRSDAQDYLKRAERQSKQFDLIILDPPTFAHGKKSRNDFAVERDLADLVAGAVALLRSGGTMLISTNHRRISMQGLRDRLREGARGRRFRITSSPHLPPDFCNASGIAKSLFVHFT